MIVNEAAYSAGLVTRKLISAIQVASTKIKYAHMEIRYK